MRVLLVENQLLSAQAVSSMLITDCKAVVDVVDNGIEAVELARRYDYDAIIIDQTLPDMRGTEVVRQVRAAGRETPVLVLCDLIGSEAKILALKAGADDVMSKPVDTDELCARLKAIIRRSKGHSQSCLQIGAMMLNLDTHQVSIEGQPVHLTGKEYAILELLALRRGAVLSKEQFLSHLYGGMDEPEIKIIDVFVCKLRKKLSQAGAPDIIATIWGRGYTIRSAVGSVFFPATAVTAFRSPSANDAAGADHLYHRELAQA